MTKRAKTVQQADDGFTARVLMSMVVDMQYHMEFVERMRIQIEALAKEHGVALPRE